MIDINDFIKNFNGLAIPEELVKLLDFQNHVTQASFYAANFELTASDGKYGLKTYSKDFNFLNSIIEFANADGIGSFYGFWLRDNKLSLKDSPIVIFGGEGGYHVVASNILEFFKILTYDTEPMVSWDSVSYVKDKKHFEPSEQSEVFKKWLFDNFKINEISNADKLVKSAQMKYQEEFNIWMKQYYNN